MDWMSIFQTQGLDGTPLQLELEGDILSFLFEQDKVLAFQTSRRAWGCWIALARQLKADWISLLDFEADRAWEQELSGEELITWDRCWTPGRNWRHEDPERLVVAALLR